MLITWRLDRSPLGKRGDEEGYGRGIFFRTRGGCFYFILLKFERMCKPMKHTKLLALILALLALFSLASCFDSPDTVALWRDATYQMDTTLGEGQKTVVVAVTAGEKTVNFTLKTDAETLGEALLANKIIEGEEGPYGLYVKKVNGILADYDIDQSYWGFYQDGEMMMTGVDGTQIVGGEHFELVYEK